MTPATKTVAPQLAKRIALENILFATDFSAVADKALEYAAMLAKNYGARLYGLHVQQPANYAIPPEMWRGTEELENRQLAGLRKTLAEKFPEVTAELLTGEGGVWQALEMAIEKYNIDLVVLGTHGRTGLGKLLLGSEAEEILRRANVPVLTVGPGVENSAGRTELFHSILFATDFGPGSKAAAKYAVSLAGENQAMLTMLHVVAFGKPGDLVRPETVEQGLERQLQNLMPEEAAEWCTPEFRIERGDPGIEILSVAEKNRADLIVLGVRQPTGVPGAATHLPIATVHHVASHATCPVLTLRG